MMYCGDQGALCDAFSACHAHISRAPWADDQAPLYDAEWQEACAKIWEEWQRLNTSAVRDDREREAVERQRQSVIEFARTLK